MYLSKLEILGFKSFADKINLIFNDGLSAIVGPNGSGKTNFVDALRWVLGEQKTSVLRSESMDNVIFNGSKNRKPLGLSEVSITIKNTKKILPSEYDEINISRRLYRDGESQYLINKVPARLKDITGLFMDTGLGADSYSVIELKMIENLLNGNPADRRDIFEEAAGIKKFKLNKKETSKKLQNVELDLERIKDILQEVQKNVNSLARQAAKTRRYNTLISELKDLEIKLFCFELFSFKTKLLVKQGDETASSEKINQLNSEISEIEDYLNNLKKEFNIVDEEYQQILKDELDLNNQLSGINSEISLFEEKINSIESYQSSIKIEIEESNKFLAESRKNIEILLSEISKLNSQNDEFLNNFDISKSEGNIIRSDYLEKEKQVAHLNSALFELKNKLSSNESLISRNAQNTERTKFKISEEEKRLTLLDQELMNFQNLHSEKKNKLVQLEAEIIEQKKIFEELLKQKNDSEQKLVEYRNLEFQNKNQLNKLNNEKSFLENLVVSDESTKFLLKNKNWLNDGEKILLGEIISVDEKYKLALNSALDFAVSAFLLENVEDARNAIQELKSARRGTASFLINNYSESQTKSKSNFTKEKGFLGYLSDFLTVNDEFKALLENLTNNIILVDDFENASKILKDIYVSKEKAEDVKIVTLNGEFFTASGFISGGGEAVNQKTQLIGRRNQLKKIDTELLNLNKIIDEIQTKFKSEQLSIANLEISKREIELKNLEKDFVLLEKEVNQIELRKESFTQNSTTILDNIEKFKFEIEEIEKENINLKNSSEKIKSDLAESNQVFEKEKSLMSELRTKLEDWNNKSKAIEIDLVKIQSEIRFKQQEKEKIESSIQITTKKIEDKEREFEENISLKHKLSQKISEDLEKKQQLIEIIQGKLSNKEIALQSRKSLLERVSNYEATLENARKNYNKQNDDFHSIKLEIASLNSKIESLQELTLEQYNLNLEEYYSTNQLNEEEINSFDISTSKTNIALIKEKISVLGNVNFQALEDYDEQKERLDFLLTQLNDLENSKSVLLETIEEINKIAIERFVSTFNQINQNFKELFKVLFGNEGEAELTLEGDSPLDASVAITAKPPFKKPSSIELLSAGEKTLTAIALLFSIYLVKPSPFCVLDEVDAPLDDSNIDKYIALIRKFSKDRQIQFILITHNKKTMEAADTLYGLTMEEEGVTKVVSVKLDK